MAETEHLRGIADIIPLRDEVDYGTSGDDHPAAKRIGQIAELSKGLEGNYPFLAREVRNPIHDEIAEVVIEILARRDSARRSVALSTDVLKPILRGLDRTIRDLEPAIKLGIDVGIIPLTNFVPEITKPELKNDILNWQRRVAGALGRNLVDIGRDSLIAQPIQK